MPVAQPEALRRILEVEIGGETYTLLLQLNGRKTICPLCGTIKQSPSACRSSFVRLRDYIDINENGEYYERKDLSNEVSTDNKGTPEAGKKTERDGRRRHAKGKRKIKTKATNIQYTKHRKDPKLQI